MNRAAPATVSAPAAPSGSVSRQRFLYPPVDLDAADGPPGLAPTAPTAPLPPAAVWRQQLLRVLLAQDGSTTRICQALVGAPVELQVHHQSASSAVPACVRQILPGNNFLFRVTSLVARGAVLMDNLVYVALDGLAEPVRRGLDGRVVPIGPLLDALWVRRTPLGPEIVATLCALLWERVGLPDAAASRAYTIATPSGNTFVIAEAFRRGICQDLAPTRPNSAERRG